MCDDDDSDYQKVIIIDAIKTKDGIPGTIYYLTPSNFKETLHISSFHDVSFLTALKVAEKLNYECISRDVLLEEVDEFFHREMPINNELFKTRLIPGENQL